MSLRQTGSYGLHMRPLLLCPSNACGRTLDAGRSRLDAGVDGPATCPECGDRMMLVTYGVIEREAMVSHATSSGAARAAGTWWR